MQLNEADPKGLVRESYRIEGITLGECRSIFMDWALSIPQERSVPEAVSLLIDTYAKAAPGHPMNGVLELALTPAGNAKRRGGRLGRIV
ncbi:hypothetical protein [Pseudogemmobacter faecipullorum]|uniref:Uncharacterized protein n=1 Tax=Pseudogemmobacter faecipullorum TaxID=2755041 RepID=A0ABS8CIZ8_9RHOB|nr:hypothetical protein [Pseudogemmobacter faecipullorum]